MEEILKRLYESKTDEEQIIEEHDLVKLTTQMDLVYGKGVLKYHKGAEYPEIGLTEPKAMFKCNFAKKLLVHTVRLYANPYQFIKFVFSNKAKYLNTLLDTYNELAMRIMGDKIVHLHFMTPAARNLRIFFTKFLQRIGVDQRIANEFAKIVGNIITLDDAYRFRMQDIASETTYRALKNNPRKELLRLFRIYKQREHEGISKKIMTIVPIMSYAMLIPSVRKAFTDTLEDIDLSEMQYDEWDIYWVAQSDAYPFMGKTKEERAYLLEGKSLPDVMTRERFARYSKKKRK